MFRKTFSAGGLGGAVVAAALSTVLSLIEYFACPRRLITARRTRSYFW